MNVKTKDRIGQGLIAAALIGTLSMLALVGFSARTAPVDPQTHCLKNEQPAGCTAIFLDHTDLLSADQRRNLVTRLRHVATEELQPNELLLVFLVGDFEDGALRPVFCSCDPGLRFNRINQNERFVAAERESVFVQPLLRLLDQLAASGTADRSPLLEATTAAAELPELQDVAGRKRFIYASDMLQNSSTFSQYRDGLSFERLRRVPVYEELKANLRGATVEVLYLTRRRDAAFQGARHRKFWREYFEACGAASVRFGLL